jgi:hypothetical protein
MIISDIKIKLNKLSGDEIEKILIKRMRTTFDIKTKSNYISMARIENKKIATKIMRAKFNVKMKQNLI